MSRVEGEQPVKPLELVREYDLETAKKNLAERAVGLEEKLKRIQKAAEVTQETMNLEFVV